MKTRNCKKIYLILLFILSMNVLFACNVNAVNNDIENITEIHSRLTKSQINSETVAFVGDSITDRGWWKPMMNKFDNISTINYGSGGDTTEDVLNRLNVIKNNNVDHYIIAIGFNDIRYDPVITWEEYSKNLQEIVNELNEYAGVAIISIWPTYYSDPYNVDGVEDKINEFNTKLLEFSNKKNLIYSLATPVINDYISTNEKVDEFIPDGRHPSGSKEGNLIYSQAVLYEDVKLMGDE